MVLVYICGTYIDCLESDLTITPEIETAMLSADHSTSQIEQLAIKAGMITMVQDGILKALEGITSLEEVFSVAE